ncbi:MAG: flagellar hook-basal body complex protein FliE [Alphaproteobacteria bacterium]|nr:flagellar hook-basal body complex protein FliE [Alphaproteobacteria bacterium]
MVMNVASALNAYRSSIGSNSSMESSIGENGLSFGDTLKEFVTDSVNTIKQGEKAASDGAVGKSDMQSVILAVDKAGVMLETVIALRDKVVSSYQEIIRMQV